MGFISKIQGNRKVYLFCLFILPACLAKGQLIPLNPVSAWTFMPSFYNPAMTGSKDFFSIGVNAAFQGNANSQLILGNTRILKKKSGYFSSQDLTEFQSLGLGLAAYNESDGLARNSGLSASASYQVPLNFQKLSFLSFGLSVKESYNTITTETKDPVKKKFYPNLDAGIYYYGTNLFAGISVINMLGSAWKPDTLGVFRVPLSKQYFFTVGYKILISKSLNIVLEPSVLITATDSTFKKISDNLSPIIKLYMEDFCVGTSFSRDNKITLFAQFRYPGFYLGALYEFPKDTPYFKSKPVIELTLGINIRTHKSGNLNRNHW